MSNQSRPHARFGLERRRILEAAAGGAVLGLSIVPGVARAAESPVRPNGTTYRRGGGFPSYIRNRDALRVYDALAVDGFVEDAQASSLADQFDLLGDGAWDRVVVASGMLYRGDGDSAFISEVVESQSGRLSDRPPEAHVWHSGTDDSVGGATWSIGRSYIVSIREGRIVRRAAGG